MAGATNDAGYPIIYSEPQSQSVAAGTEVQMSVVALASPAPTYQWEAGAVGSGVYTNLSDGGFIVGSSTSSLTITYATSNNMADYVVVVSNSLGVATSTPATLTVTGTAPPPGPPVALFPPQSRVETVGDHLAFTVTASGTPPIHYQWQSNGVPIASATTTVYRLTNIVVADSASYAVVCSSLFGTNTYSATLTVTPSLQSISSNNLEVVRVGDGAQALSSTTANTVYLDQITPAGVYSNTIMAPDNVAATALIVPGGVPEGAEGSLLTQTADTNFLNFCGFNTTYPAAISLLGSGVYRAIGGVDAYGYFSLPQVNDTLYTAEDIFNAAVSLDGFSEFWTTGSASAPPGIKYTDPATAGTAGGNLALAGSAAGTRAINIVDGNVLYSDVGASPPGIYAFYGEPNYTQTPEVLISDAAGSPNDFAASPDTNPGNLVTSTVYLADSSSITNGGGIQRYDWNGGEYALTYTLGTGTNSIAGASGLTVDFSANATWGPGVLGAVLYATTAGASGNSLLRIVDMGLTSNAIVLAQANGNEILRGVRFGPVPGPVMIASNPQPQTAFVGATVTFTVAAVEGPFTYQWQLNGINLTNGPSPTGSGAVVSGAQTATLKVANIGPADDQGQYAVVVNNPFPNGGVTTTPALLTIPVNIISFPAVLEDVTNGGTAHFTVVATGGGTLAYQWEGPCGAMSDGVNGCSGSGSVIAGSSTASLTISGVQPADDGSYYVMVSNAESETNSGAELSVLTVVTAPQFAPGDPLTGLGGASPQLNLSGTAGTTYRVWGSTNLALTPVTGKWTLLGSGTFSGGADSFAISPTNNDQFYVITQP